MFGAERGRHNVYKCAWTPRKENKGFTSLVDLLTLNVAFPFSGCSASHCSAARYIGCLTQCTSVWMYCKRDRHEMNRVVDREQKEATRKGERRRSAKASTHSCSRVARLDENINPPTQTKWLNSVRLFSGSIVYLDECRQHAQAHAHYDKNSWATISGSQICRKARRERNSSQCPLPVHR